MKGFTLVEVVVATSIILVFLLALFGVNNLYLKSAFLNTDSIKATFLAEEGLEAMRFLRNSSWEDNILPLSAGTNYNLIFLSNAWIVNSSSDYVDNLFERRAVLSDVYRDVLDDIVTSGGTLDPYTKMVTINVSWSTRGATTTKSISTYLSNILDE